MVRPAAARPSATLGPVTVTTGVSAAPASLWRNRGFNAFWSAQILSVLGDSFSQLAVPLLVLDATGSIATAGLLTGVSGTAAVVAGLLAGVVVDRFDRRALLIGADVARMLLFAAAPWCGGWPRPRRSGRCSCCCPWPRRPGCCSRSPPSARCAAWSPARS